MFVGAAKAMQAEFDTDSILGSSKQRKGYGIAGRSSNPNSAEGSGGDSARREQARQGAAIILGLPQ